MNANTAIIAFYAGFTAAEKGEDCAVACQHFIDRMPKRTRKWIIRPCPEFPEGIRPANFGRDKKPASP